MAASASSRLIAGPWAMLAVPYLTLREIRSGWLKSEFTPISTQFTSAPACLAKTFTAAPPAKKFNTICGVTSAGNALIPSSQTPWSAAMTITARSVNEGFTSPVIPASLTAKASSLPRLPGGFVKMSKCCSAAAIAAVFGASIKFVSSLTDRIITKIPLSIAINNKLHSLSQSYHTACFLVY
ncbi:hypothetical protein D3C78_1201450 [compost metagenome]